VPEEEYARVAAHFVPYAYAQGLDDSVDLRDNVAFGRWIERNVRLHRVAGYRAVVLSLKKTGTAPGDATAEQLDQVADWSERYGFGEIRVTHEQNLVLPDVRVDQLFALWQELRGAGLATPNIGLLTDIISCPGGDFCGLANAKSIPIAKAIQHRFDDLDYIYDLGEINLNISGCINSCGHHHVGHIGILGVDKDGSEWYQVSIGGADGSSAGHGRVAVGKIIGPSFAADEVPEVIEQLIGVYVARREEGERFVETVARIGLEPFKHGVYANRKPHALAEAA
jgi:sulfite reductase (NADPH) hemoprotein beta-component